MSIRRLSRVALQEGHLEKTGMEKPREESTGKKEINWVKWWCEVNYSKAAEASNRFGDWKVTFQGAFSSSDELGCWTVAVGKVDGAPS
jgi:hypothetical protein